MTRYNRTGTVRLYWNKADSLKYGLLINEIEPPERDPELNAYLSGMSQFGVPKESVGVHTFDLANDGDIAVVDTVIKAIEEAHQYFSFVRMTESDEYDGFFISDVKPNPLAAFHPDLLAWEPPTLDEIKAAKLAEINAVKWAQVDGGTEYNGIHISTDADAQRLANGAVTQCLINNAYTCQWKMSDGSYTTLGCAEIIGVATVIRAHIQACFDREAELGALVASAATVEEVQAIVW